MGIYEFGPFRLHPAERQLLRDGRPVPLTSKAFDTLRALVESGGRALRASLQAGLGDPERVALRDPGHSRSINSSLLIEAGQLHGCFVAHLIFEVRVDGFAVLLVDQFHEETQPFARRLNQAFSGGFDGAHLDAHLQILPNGVEDGRQVIHTGISARRRHAMQALRRRTAWRDSNIRVTTP